MLQHEGWTDVGAQGHRWGARRAEATCWAPNSGLTGTRRDYIFVNMTLLPYIVGFGVCPLDELPTHALLQILLSKPCDDYATTRAVKPASLHKHFEAKLEEIKDEMHKDEGEDERPKTEKERTACRQQLLIKLHANMDRIITKEQSHIDQETWNWDTRAAWRRIAKCIELGFIDALELDDVAAKNLKDMANPSSIRRSRNPSTMKRWKNHTGRP